MTTRVIDPNVSLNIVQLLNSFQQGHAVNELMDHIRNVAQAVITNEKDGTVEFKIKIGTVKGAPNAVYFKAESKANPPKTPVPTDIFFISKEGSFHFNNPKQPDLFGPRPVDGPVIDGETGEILSMHNRSQN